MVQSVVLSWWCVCLVCVTGQWVWWHLYWWSALNEKLSWCPEGLHPTSSDLSSGTVSGEVPSCQPQPQEREESRRSRLTTVYTSQSRFSGWCPELIGSTDLADWAFLVDHQQAGPVKAHLLFEPVFWWNQTFHCTNKSLKILMLLSVYAMVIHRLQQKTVTLKAAWPVPAHQLTNRLMWWTCLLFSLQCFFIPLCIYFQFWQPYSFDRTCSFYCGMMANSRGVICHY